MANKQKNQEAIRQEQQAENRISKTEEFYNRYKNVIWGALCAVLVIWLGTMAYQKFIYQPKCEEAQEQAFIADKEFEKASAGVAGQPVDSLTAVTAYTAALRGDADGNVMGYAEIIDEYGAKAGKDVYLKAGICAFGLGEYEEAITYLKGYDSGDVIMQGRALNLTGDCYVNLGQYQKAVEAFAKSAAVADNIYAAEALVKEGLAYEALGDKAAALKCYKDAKYRYPDSLYGPEIDNYIAAVEE